MCWVLPDGIPRFLRGFFPYPGLWHMGTTLLMTCGNATTLWFRVPPVWDAREVFWNARQRSWNVSAQVHCVCRHAARRRHSAHQASTLPTVSVNALPGTRQSTCRVTRLEGWSLAVQLSRSTPTGPEFRRGPQSPRSRDGTTIGPIIQSIERSARIQTRLLGSRPYQVMRGQLELSPVTGPEPLRAPPGTPSGAPRHRWWPAPRTDGPPQRRPRWPR